jgi:hypothetical protein
MPLHVNDLQPGDRVVLNCAAGRGRTKCEALFDGIFENYAAAAKIAVSVLAGPRTEAFSVENGAVARFVLQTTSGPTRVFEYPGGGEMPPLPDFDGESCLIAIFRIEPDGALREEQGRRITIEMRVRMGQG